MQAKHLPRAPITEALLDIQVAPRTGVTTSILEGFHQRVREHYPTRKSRFHVSAAINVGQPSVKVQQNDTHVGFLFSSTDGRQVVQARLDGFSFSRLAPYEDWERLKGEAQRLWKIYREIVHPSRVSRIALRYINRINLPRPFQFEDYLKALPILGDGFPQNLSGLFMRVVAPVEDAIVTLSEAIDEDAVTHTTVPVILDIEAVRPLDISADDDINCWKQFENLRSLKNRVFFGSLTDRAEDLFK